MRENREYRRLGLPTGRGGQEDAVLPIENGAYCRLLRRTQPVPPQRIDDVMLNGWMQAIKGCLLFAHSTSSSMASMLESPEAAASERVNSLGASVSA